MAYILIIVIGIFFLGYSVVLLSRIDKLEQTIIRKDHKIDDIQTSYYLVQEQLEKELRNMETNRNNWKKRAKEARQIVEQL